MRECDRCGFPRKFARFFEWRSDGTIVSANHMAPLQRAFLETGELDKLLDSLSGTIGVSVDRFLIEAQKNIGKALYENLPMRHLRRIPNKSHLRPQWAAELMIRFVSAGIAELGDGRLGIDRYRAGDFWVLRFENPCVIPMLVGSSLGIFESMEGASNSTFEYGIESNDLVIRMSPGGTAGESEKRLYLENVEPGEGRFVFDRCPECAAPLPAAMTFEWDVRRGIITNRLTGEREVVVAVQSVNATLRELEKELGEEIPGILFETQKRLDLNRLSALSCLDTEVFWTGYLAELAIHGLGFPLRFERVGASVSVETGNTYNQLLYAAKIAAGLERVTGRDSSIEWIAREPSRAVYTISA